MAIPKKFFRVRLKDNCSVKTKVVNGITLTKNWQVKVGDIGDLAKFSDVETQVLIKHGNTFITPGEAPNSGKPSNPAPSQESAPITSINFHEMTVEQLKTYLVSRGVSQNDLKNVSKPELIERAEFIYSQL